MLDAHRIAQAIASTPPASIEDNGSALLEVDGMHVGEVVSIPESKILGRQWMGVQFARADVTRAAMRLLDDGEVWVPGEQATAKVPMCRVSEIGEIGPDIRDVRDGFALTGAKTAYVMVANHDTKKRRGIATIPDQHLSPLSEPLPGRRLKPLELLWPRAGKLLIGARFRLNTVRVIAMRSERDTLGSMWWPVRVDNDLFEKALAVWLNSSVGLLPLLATRNTTMGAWAQTKKADLKEMPVLDVRAISQSQLQGLADLFDELADEEFERLPGMADCAARRRLDDGLSAILGLPDLSGLRRLLATEPVVANRRL